MKIEFQKIFEELDALHFDCGEEALNLFIQRKALNEQKQRVNTTVVALVENQDPSLVGFYSICPTEISKENLSKKVGRGVPYHTVGGWRIGRLAVDKRMHKKGVGEKLLIHALLKCSAASKQFGGRFVAVDAKHQKAASFYKRYGFVEIQSNPLNLVIKISDVEKSFGIHSSY